MSFESIQAVLFHVDSTLFDHDHSFRAGIEAVVQTYCPECRNRPLDEVVQQYRESLEFDTGDLPEYPLSYLEKCGFLVTNFLAFANPDLYDIPDSYAAVVDTTFFEAYERSLRPMPYVLETLIWLRNNDIQIIVITQDEVRHPHILHTIGVLDLVDRIFLGGDLEDFGHPQQQVLMDIADALNTSPRDMLLFANNEVQARNALSRHCGAVFYDPEEYQLNRGYYESYTIWAVSDFRHLPQLLVSSEPINLRLSIEYSYEPAVDGGHSDGTAHLAPDHEDPGSNLIENSEWTPEDTPAEIVDAGIGYPFSST